MYLIIVDVLWWLLLHIQARTRHFRMRSYLHTHTHIVSRLCVRVQGYAVPASQQIQDCFLRNALTTCLLTIFWTTTNYYTKILCTLVTITQGFYSGNKKLLRHREVIWKPQNFISPYVNLTVSAVNFLWRKCMLPIVYVPLKSLTLLLALINPNCYIPCVLFAFLLLIPFPWR